MLYNTQGDPRWGNDGMGLPADPMRLWACLITAIANIYDILPGELNKWLVENNGYYGKGFPGKESFLKWEIIENHLNFLHSDFFEIPVFDDKTFYIVRIHHRKYGTEHYCNMLAIDDADPTKFKIFDTDYGDILSYATNQILGITKIKKL